MSYNKSVVPMWARDEDVVMLADVFMPGVNHAGAFPPDAYGDSNADGTPDSADGYSIGLTSFRRVAKGEYAVSIEGTVPAILGAEISLALRKNRTTHVSPAIVAPFGGADGKTINFRCVDKDNNVQELNYDEQISVRVWLRLSGNF